jgi:hypothetical protein
MQFDNQQLREQIIVPTLQALGIADPTLVEALGDVLECPPRVGAFSASAEGYGIFNITARQHRDLWDNHLAFDPDLASLVRGFASQRAFLENPEMELQCNLRYCVAIAALLWLRSGAALHAKPRAILRRAAG